MTSPPRPARPLSPHLQIYRWQITMALSILHRATGIGLCAALPVFVCWLVALGRGPEDYALFTACLTAPLGKLFLMGWSWALCYHLCSGARHLLWDMGIGLELKGVYTGGYLAIGISTLLTLILWIAILGS